MVPNLSAIKGKHVTAVSSKTQRHYGKAGSHERPLGAHMSIAGGLVNAVEKAEQAGATALQIFTRNQVRWESPPLKDAEARAFLEEVRSDA